MKVPILNDFINSNWPLTFQMTVLTTALKITVQTSFITTVQPISALVLNIVRLNLNMQMLIKEKGMIIVEWLFQLTSKGKKGKLCTRVWKDNLEMKSYI